MTSLQLNLYENAIDSITHSIEHYINDPVEERRYKYAILHLAQGAFLILKERLSKEHPNYIYPGITNTDKTVDVNLCIVRLRKVAGVAIDDDVEKMLLELANTRNDIEHYEMDLQKATVDSLIARAVTFLVDFVADELGRSFPDEIGRDTWDALQSIMGYRQHAISIARAKILASGDSAYYCQKCQAETATLQESESPIGFREENFAPAVYRVTCKACLEMIDHGFFCSDCGAQVSVPLNNFLNPEYSYCTDCKDRLAVEFAGFERPTYVAEVRRWFETHDTVTIHQLLSLVLNVSTHGPTGAARYPRPLLERGLIEYAHDSIRERNEKLRRIREESDYSEHFFFPTVTGFQGDEIFVWVGEPKREGEFDRADNKRP
jgi:hypothetical protein